HALDDLGRLAAEGTIELQPFEYGKRSVLAAPISVTPGVQVVLELFDRQVGGRPAEFTAAEKQLVRAASDFGGELVRQARAERQTQRLLFDAVGQALQAGDSVAQTLRIGAEARPEDPPPPDILERLRTGLEETRAPIDAAATLRLAEAIRVLALRYGPRAVE